MKLYLISESDAQHLMRAPAAAGGYVATGPERYILPLGYVAKLPDSMATGSPMSPEEAALCLAELDKCLAHAGKPGVMGRIAEDAAKLDAMIRPDLLAFI